MSNGEEMLWIVGVEGFATCVAADKLEPEQSISCWFSAESKAAGLSWSNASDLSSSTAAEVDSGVPGGDGEEEGCGRLRPWDDGNFFLRLPQAEPHLERLDVDVGMVVGVGMLYEKR